MEVTGLTLRGSGCREFRQSSGSRSGSGGGGGHDNGTLMKQILPRKSAPRSHTSRPGGVSKDAKIKRFEHAAKRSEDRRCDAEEARCTAEEKQRVGRESKSAEARNPVRMSRAKEWSMLVEDNHRFQCGGWRDANEYAAVHGAPERWDNGFIKCVRVKKNGYFTYWRNYRECEDRLVKMVKLYEY